MKNYYLFLFLLFGFFGKAQIVNFPDANFKAKLLAATPSNGIAQDLTGNYFKIDTNSNGEIEVSEALNISLLNIGNSSIQNLDGILNFSNVEYIYCSNNQLSNLNVNGLVNLTNLNCSYNQLLSLDVSALINLEILNCTNNQLSSLNVNGLINLKSLFCSSNQLSSLNVDDLVNLNYFHCNFNQLQTLNISNLSNLLVTVDCNYNQLTSLFIKNGTNAPPSFSSNPNLIYICADENEIDAVMSQLYLPQYSNTQVNSYCSFTPGGQFYTIQGQQKFDNENDNCDNADLNIPYQKFIISDGMTTGMGISNNLGNYSIHTLAGSNTLTPVFENPNYFITSPTNVVVDFPTQTSPYNQNFCIVANGSHGDVEISIIPITAARPGFSSTYKIIYKNKGNQVESGTINLQFDDNALDIVSTNPTFTTQSINNLNWTYSNLEPFETRSIIVAFYVNSPLETPAVNAGDFLIFSAEITQLGLDEMLNDNSFGLKQIVVNSYDPNDKTCLQGNVVGPDKIGEFVHYMIRFENTGTFPAENIVVKDMIDTSKFDVSSLVPLHASHNYVVKITVNKVEFIFENINLPFDDANNDGYVAFKIKTSPTLVLGNTFSNSANIYFDYNFPIVTNTATTTIAALSNPSFQFDNYFSLYPNPTTNELNINLKSVIEVNSIQIFNSIGQLVTVQTGNALKVDVSNLKTGNYFIKINTNEGFTSSQFIKE